MNKRKKLKHTEIRKEENINKNNDNKEEKREYKKRTKGIF